MSYRSVNSSFTFVFKSCLVLVEVNQQFFRACFCALYFGGKPDDAGPSNARRTNQSSPHPEAKKVTKKGDQTVLKHAEK
jgi:hypothetical protein